MTFWQLLLVVFGWTVLGIGVVTPIGFAIWWAFDRTWWLVLPAIGMTAIIIAFDIWIGFVIGFWPTQQEIDASHCSTGTRYVEYTHTVLQPVVAGKSTVLIPTTITDWKCIAA